ncbi:MAG: hypothetical protein D6736_22150 [Nitrospinota bacterium]|nr:MAG: hypothetical protein D6736_22150 [Nitrospinota bacterium]
MPFTVEDFRDLLRLLEQHPEWRSELRRWVLSEELLSLPHPTQSPCHPDRSRNLGDPRGDGRCPGQKGLAGDRWPCGTSRRALRPLVSPVKPI